jgi:hypothetical protein
MLHECCVIDWCHGKYRNVHQVFYHMLICSVDDLLKKNLRSVEWSVCWNGEMDMKQSKILDGPL